MTPDLFSDAHQYIDTTPAESVPTDPLAVDPLDFKLLRKKLGWSAARLAYELNVSRSYVKHIESEDNPWPIRPRLARRFRALQKRVHLGLSWGKSQRTVIYSRLKIPDQLTVYAKPRKCRGHHRWCIFKTTNQRYCGAECKRLYHQRRRRWRSNRKR